MRKEQWRYLSELNKTHSIHATSQKLNISSQALGASIRSLENELGLTLLNRSHLGVTLTDNGQAVLRLADRFWSGVAELRQKESAASGQGELPQELELWVSYGGMACYAPQIIADLSKKIPRIKISVHEILQKELIDKLRKSEIPFALTLNCISQNRTITPLPEDIVFKAISRSKLYCLVPSQYPIAEYKTISIKTACKFPLLLFTPTGAPENSVLPILKTIAAPANYTLESNTLVYKAKMVAGNAIGFRFATPFPIDGEFENYLRKIPISDDLLLEVGSIYLKDSPEIISNPIFQRYLKD